MATNSFGDPIEAPQASAPHVNSFGDPVESASGHASVLQELWRQADLPGIVKSLKEHPLDTVASAIGGLFAPLNPNFTQSPQGQAMKENLTRSPESATAAGILGALALAPGLAGKFGGAIPEEVGVAARGAAAGTVKAIPNAIETSAIKYTGVPQLARGAVTGAKQALAKFREGQAPPAPRAISPEEYYANQSVPAAEVPPQPPQSAPAPTTASAAPPSVPISTQTSPSLPPKVQPIRPETPPVPTSSPTTEPTSVPTSEPTMPKPASGATAAKSARYADAISKWARDHGLSVKQIADQWETADPETKGQIYIELQRKGYLGANETIPKTSAQGIVDALKAKAATIKPPKGFSMGDMGATQ